MQEVGEYQIATKGKRTVAFFIDSFVIVLFLIAIYTKQWVVAVDSEDFSLFFTNDKFLVISLLGFIYHTLFVWQNGMTLGKMLMKIRVVEIDTASTPSLTTALLRSGFRVISDNSLMLGYLVAFFSPLLQSFHDKIAKTIVVDA
ncbi:RDD family protein [Sulfurovum sp. bin170]|uniref:RDD family protein n=1 Tax=Sulfurovum sp. bin170 TaxID=2695268 RepID=UPI0013DFAD63|nr:RDD family protein [Sulfurovum sp. bin170]NEW61309.1 RDD family protein [Sulfurovum sp. bin170]